MKKFIVLFGVLVLFLNVYSLEVIVDGKTIKMKSDKLIEGKVEPKKKNIFEQLDSAVNNVDTFLNGGNRSVSPDGSCSFNISDIVELKKLNSRYKGWYRFEILFTDEVRRKIRVKESVWNDVFDNKSELQKFKTLSVNTKSLIDIPKDLTFSFEVNNATVYVKDGTYTVKGNLTKLEKNLLMQDVIPKQVAYEVKRIKKTEQEKLAMIQQEKEDKEQKQRENEIIQQRQKNKCQFKKAKWGMSKEDVYKLEGGKGNEESDENTIEYYGHELGIDLVYSYEFKENKLYKKVYSQYDVEMYNLTIQMEKFRDAIASQYGSYRFYNEFNYGHTYEWIANDTKIILNHFSITYLKLDDGDKLRF